MNRVLSSAVVVAGLVFMLGGTASWGQVPFSNDESGFGGNTGGGTFALSCIAEFDSSGQYNTAYGFAALNRNCDGFGNTAMGFDALRRNKTGSYNTALGYQALYNSEGGHNLALGYNAGFHLKSGDFNIYMGNTAVASESNTMRLGHRAVTDGGVTSGIARTFIAGIWGTPTPPVEVSGEPIALVSVFINADGQLGILASSARYKRDIHTMRERSQGLYQLRPVTFRYKHDRQGQRQYGLIAEEVAKVYPELVTKGADGKVQSVQYHELIPLLLNEVQHQQQKLAELKAQNEEQRAQNAALAARLERLEQGATRTAAVATR